MVKPTQFPPVCQQAESDASRLLDLEGLAVAGVALDAFGCRMVHLVTADECASACPTCGVLGVGEGVRGDPAAGHSLRGKRVAAVLA